MKKTAGSKCANSSVGLATANMVYHGGPLLANVEVTTIYWGSAWGADPLRAQLNAFFDFVVTSSLIDQLSEYNASGFSIGHGKHVSSVLIMGDPPNPLDDTVIQSTLDSLVQASTVPAPNSNSVYFFFLPSGVTVTIQGASSCQQFCGYHNTSNSGLFYAVDTYDDCTGCEFVPGDILASSTVVASHELCEAITDPNVGTGWFDDQTGNEIGDVCEGSVKTLNMAGVLSGAQASPVFNVSVSPAQLTIDGTAPVQVLVTLTPAPTVQPPPPPPPPPGQSWTVQKEWSQAQGKCI